jgi:hypothetical protein
MNEPVAGPEGGEKGVVDVLRPAESSVFESFGDDPVADSSEIEDFQSGDVLLTAYIQQAAGRF